MRFVPPAYTPLPPSALLTLAGSSSGQSEALRRLLVETHGSPDVHLVGSGTQALTLALSALAGGGGAVALPGWGCFDLASAAVGAGAGVRLYDLDPETLQPDLASLERILEDVAAVVLVSFFGIPIAPAVQELVRQGEAAVVHDAAQAHGATFGPGSIEEVADATVLSFGRGKGWTGLGGGALVVRSDRAKDATQGWRSGSERLAPASVRRGALAVRGAAQWLLGRPAVYGIPARIPALGLGDTRYHPPHALEALSDVSARVLLASRAASEAEAEFRRHRAAALLTRLPEGGRVQAIRVVPSARPGYLRLPVLSAYEIPAEARALGVMPSYPAPLVELEPLKPFLQAVDPTPGSARLAGTLVTLPTHSRTSTQDRARLEAWLETSPASPRR